MERTHREGHTGLGRRASLMAQASLMPLASRVSRLHSRRASGGTYIAVKVFNRGCSCLQVKIWGWGGSNAPSKAAA